MIMVMGLIITMRTRGNGTLNCVCHPMTRAVACFYIARAWRGAGFGTGKGPAGQELSQEDKHQPGCIGISPGK